MRFSTAIVASVVAHGLVAVGIVAYMKYAPGPTAIATLDLSSVDLSFAEDEDETVAVSPTMPAMPEVEPPKPREEKPPEAERTEDPLPPDPAAPKLAEPEPEHEKMETPELKPEPEKPKVEHPPAESVPAVAPKQAKIDAPPKPHKAIKPDYPKGARQRGEQGDVVLEMPRELLTASTSFRLADFQNLTKLPFVRRVRRVLRPRSLAVRLSPLPPA